MDGMLLRAVVDKLPDKAPEICFAWVHRWWSWSDTWWGCMTKSEWSGWAQAIGTLLAVWLTWLWSSGAERKRIERTRKAHLETVATDVRIADRQALVYLRSKILLPAYRIPLHGQQTALPWLLAEGELSTAQVMALAQFYVDATSFNFCLDVAQRLKEAGRPWSDEVRRIKIKASHLVPAEDRPAGITAYSRFDEAIKALRKAGLADPALERIPIKSRVEGEMESEDD